MVDINNKKKTHACLVFIHEILTQRTQYFLSEIDVGKDAAKLITEMANRLSDDIKEEENPNEPA
jgi:hypothetical protein